MQATSSTLDYWQHCKDLARDSSVCAWDLAENQYYQQAHENKNKQLPRGIKKMLS